MCLGSSGGEIQVFCLGESGLGGGEGLMVAVDRVVRNRPEELGGSLAGPEFMKILDAPRGRILTANDLFHYAWAGKIDQLRHDTGLRFG